jgi:tetratricopeptide (TPR) repeat protein
MFSLAINYAISGEQAWSYHLLNLLLHLANCFLVYRFVFLLSRNAIVSFITALLFGVHPMHVESVAWVSERKDVLYCLFFLAGHISYTRYIDEGSKKQYWLTLLFLVLSLLSKPAAVIFPVSLFCIDILKRRKLNTKLFTEKIWFIIPAVIIGWITMTEQKNIGAAGDESFGLVKSIFFGFYGIMMYAVKMILPFKQSAFYPFPPINQALPTVYYISPIITIALLVVFFIGLKKHRFLSFGISFYLVNLLLVLQVFSVGSAVIAERYTYIPYIGLFYIAGMLVSLLVKQEEKKAMTFMIPVGLFFAVLTYTQSAHWKNGVALWDNVIKNYPSSRAYGSRAALYRKENQTEMAIRFYTRAIEMNKADQESLNNRGNIYTEQNKLDSALIDYRNSLAIKPDYYVAHDNIGSLYSRTGNYDSALVHLNKAIELKPDYKSAYRNRGVTYLTLNRFAEAMKDWKIFLRYEPNDPIVINTIGLCHLRLGQYNESIPYFDKAIAINPLAPFYLNRSNAYFSLNNLELARRDALAARQAGGAVPEDYLRALGLQ